MRTKRIISIILIILIATLLFVGCKKAESAPYAPPSDTLGGAEIISEVVLNQSNRKIIYTVDIRMTTEDFSKTLKDLYAAIEEDETAGNWIKSANITSNQNYQAAYISVKVKTTSLNAFISGLPNLGTITSQKQNSEDITYNYAMIEAKITALTTEKAYYEDLISKASVNYIEQYIIKIRNINTELALMNDQLIKYDNDLEYSTVNIDINAYTVEEEEYVPYWTSIKNVFKGSIKFLLAIFKGIGIAIVAVAPFGAIVSIALVIVYYSKKLIKIIKEKKKHKQ